jgi:hypothetical protein
MHIIVWAIGLIIGGAAWIMIALKAASSVPELTGVAVAWPTLFVFFGLAADHVACRTGDEGEHSVGNETTPLRSPPAQLLKT